jgi:phosphotransferase family enzyme
MTLPTTAPMVREAFPSDDALPNLAMLLDAAHFAGSVEAATGAVLGDAAARWLRWSPGKRAVVLYEVSLAGVHTWAVATIAGGLDAAQIASMPEVRRLADSVRSRCAATEPVHALGDLGALVEWYPAAINLPGLVSISQRIGALGEPELVVYRPGQRAVLRAGDLYWKAYASPARFARAVKGMEQAARIDGLESPKLVALFPQDRLTAQRAIVGDPFPDTPEAAAALGEMLRRLHVSSVRPPRIVTAADHLSAGRKVSARAAAGAPWLASRVSSVIRRLARRQPPDAEAVPSHGDFHDRQALSAGGATALLDFDSMMLADPAFDFARYGAHNVNGPGDLERAFRRIDDLAVGYGDRPKAISWYLAVALLRRTSHPLRRLRPDWAERTGRLLEAAEAVAGR